jgi:hypothetical protein
MVTVLFLAARPHVQSTHELNKPVLFISPSAQLNASCTELYRATRSRFFYVATPMLLHTVKRKLAAFYASVDLAISSSPLGLGHTRSGVGFGGGSITDTGNAPAS